MTESDPTDYNPADLLALAARITTRTGVAVVDMDRAAAALNAAAINPRDEYHTMEELYEYRMLYNALACNAWAKHDTYPVVKSWRHSDGELCFGGGWFIVSMTLPEGQVSNHYEAKHWGLFTVPAVETAPEYDGHTPKVAAERMHAALVREASQARPFRDDDPVEAEEDQ